MRILTSVVTPTDHALSRAASPDSLTKLLDLVFARDYTPERMYDLEIPVEHQRNALRWLNEMRNFLAHEFDALENKQFAGLVGCFHLP
ncbi:MAG: hypothetical protein ACXW19_00925 [Thermoanaerobaculia bacterium]